MVIALVIAGAVGAGMASYAHDGRPLVVVGFVLVGSAAGYLLSRFRHWQGL